MTAISGPDRRPGTRSDAQRNRQRILDAASRALTAATGPEPVTIETIAHDAGVGIGTLYRNFPSREALIEEVYRSELTRLCSTATHLLADHPPVAALREWMRRYQDFVATKRGMAEALRAAIASGAINSGHTREHLNAAIATILDAGRTDGSLRADVPPADISASLAGIMLAAADTDQATRMLQLLVDSLLTHHPTPPP